MNWDLAIAIVFCLAPIVLLIVLMIEWADEIFGVDEDA